MIGRLGFVHERDGRGVRGPVAAWVAVLVSGAVAQPANDSCETAIDLSEATFPHLSAAVAVGGAAILPEAPMECEASSYTIWYKYRPEVSGEITVSTCPGEAVGVTLPDTMLSIYRSSGASCGALTSVACSDDACGLRSRASAVVTAGTTYFIQVGKFGTSPPPTGLDEIAIYMTAPLPLPADRWVEQRDAGELPGTAQTPEGRGTLGSIAGALQERDSDLFAIDVCDFENFSASVEAGPEMDSQLFLFDGAGRGVVSDDDYDGSLLSRITSLYVLEGGRYYLGISVYDRDPVNDDGLEIWLDTPAAVERPADGPGADGPVAAWTLDGFGGGAYVMVLTGARFPVLETCWGSCPADYDGNGGVDGSDVGAFFEDWQRADPCADTNLDGSIDGADVEAFFVPWENGGC